MHVSDLPFVQNKDYQYEVKSERGQRYLESSRYLEVYLNASTTSA